MRDVSSMKIQAIILAGGKGTRLAPLTDTIPKPLVRVADKPILDHVLAWLKRYGVTRVALSIAHMADQIQAEYGDGSSRGMEISYLVEPTPMGTAGWTKLVDFDALENRFLVLNADNIFYLDLDRFLVRHQEVGGIATIAAVKIPSKTVSGAEALVANGDKTRLDRYVDREDSGPLLEANDSIYVSSGWYVMTPSVRDFIPEQEMVSMEKDLWPALARNGFFKSGKRIEDNEGSFSMRWR